jgi:hypothetical protein
VTQSPGVVYEVDFKLGDSPNHANRINMKDTPNSAADISAEEIYKTVVSSGQSALNAFLTMNGGASLAFLAFIGNALKEHALNEVAGGILVHALQLFIMGTFAAVCAFGTIFLTNCLSSIGWHGMKKLMFGITLLFGLASLGFFVGASATAINGFTAAKLFSPAQGTQTPAETLNNPPC